MIVVSDTTPLRHLVAIGNIPMVNQFASIGLFNTNSDSGPKRGIFFGKA